MCVSGGAGKSIEISGVKQLRTVSFEYPGPESQKSKMLFD